MGGLTKVVGGGRRWEARGARCQVRDGETDWTGLGESQMAEDDELFFIPSSWLDGPGLWRMERMGNGEWERRGWFVSVCG